MLHFLIFVGFIISLGVLVAGAALLTWTGISMMAGALVGCVFTYLWLRKDAVRREQLEHERLLALIAAARATGEWSDVPMLDFGRSGMRRIERIEPKHNRPPF